MFKKNETKLEIILSSWNFNKSIIEKYKLIGIDHIFDWQAECLNQSTVIGINRYLKELFIISIF
jgi:hypothetical protein